jgi:hypothetical protein
MFVFVNTQKKLIDDSIVAADFWIGNYAVFAADLLNRQWRGFIKS